jgi:hypothetical protein
MKRIVGLLALLFLAAPAAAQESPLSPPAKYEHKAAFEYGRGRAVQPHLQAALDTAPSVTFADCKLAAYDSRSEPRMAAVAFRNQKSCGSCWDFSGIRTIAYARAKFGLMPFQLSEQYVLDCCRNGGCNGDDNTSVLKAAKIDGIPADTDYPAYHASEGHCATPKGEKIKIKDWMLVDGNNYDRPGDTQKIKNAIFATGAVGSAVAAGGSWNGYSGGVHRGNSRQIDHDVVLTGWQDDPSIPEGGWWWMDNSWSAEWGIGGRMKIAYGADMIGTEPVCVILDAPPAPVPPGPVVGGVHLLPVILVVLLLGGIAVAAFFIGRHFAAKAA